MRGCPVGCPGALGREVGTQAGAHVCQTGPGHGRKETRLFPGGLRSCPPPGTSQLCPQATAPSRRPVMPRTLSPWGRSHTPDSPQTPGGFHAW